MTEGDTRQGLVTRKQLGEYRVQSNGHEFACSPSNALRKELIRFESAAESSRPTARALGVADISDVDPVAVGDLVSFIEGADQTGLIRSVLPRRNELTRVAAGRAPRRQVIVANVDQVVAMVSVSHPAPNWQLLDRLLVTVEAAAITPVVCFTKLDLIDEFPEAEVYRGIGYTTLETSTVTGHGVDSLSAAMAGNVSVVVGMSGVGKSSLLNAIAPGLEIDVAAVSESSQKGRHTTTHLEMHELPNGGRVVDTPGIKYFGLWGVSPDDIVALMPELRELLGRCQFRDCRHLEEPGCAIRHALKRGSIAASRYDSYRAIREAVRQEY
ncbi:MAG: ribosome small subunit-dependent GTPase A [Acidimicrobiia bacterium]